MRRQFGLEQNYRIRNIGDDPVFSEFEVTNPQTQRSYRVAVRGEPLGEICVHYGPRCEVRFKPGANYPISVTTEAHRYFDATGILKPAAYGKIENLLSTPPRRGHEIRCYDDVLDAVAQHRDHAALTRRIDRMFPGDSNSPVFADLLKLKLHPYQREDALFGARTGRCLIADDMGLGKTI